MTNGSAERLCDIALGLKTKYIVHQHGQQSSIAEILKLQL